MVEGKLWRIRSYRKFFISSVTFHVDDIKSGDKRVDLRACVIIILHIGYLHPHAEPSRANKLFKDLAKML